MSGRHDGEVAVRPIEPGTGPPPPRRPPSQGRGRRLSAATLASVLAIVTAGLIINRFQPADEAAATSVTTTTTAAPGLQVYSDPAFHVGYPEGWDLAVGPLSSSHQARRDLFTASTFEVVSVSTECEHLPTAVLVDMGRDDAFVWVGENDGLRFTQGDDPVDFAAMLQGVDEGGEILDCLAPEERDDFGVLQWFPLGRAGGIYQVVVGVGSEAPVSKIAEAVAILDSFDPNIRLSLGGLHLASLGWDGERIWLARVLPGDPSAGTIDSIDPDTGGLLSREALGGSPTLLAGDAEAVWVAHGESGRLSRLDRDTGAVAFDMELSMPTFRGHPDDDAEFQPNALAVEDGTAWVLSAQGALAEVRSGGRERTVGTIQTEGEPHALAVVDGTPWVAAGRRLYRYGPAFETSLGFDHTADHLGANGDLLLVAGTVPGAFDRASLVDAVGREVVGSLEIENGIAAIVTVEGVFGVLDTTGVLHPADGGPAWLTDLVPSSLPTVQAGPELWTATGPDPGLRRVRLVGEHGAGR